MKALNLAGVMLFVAVAIAQMAPALLRAIDSMVAVHGALIR